MGAPLLFQDQAFAAALFVNPNEDRAGDLLASPVIPSVAINANLEVAN
jgi:hypothetical protein